MSSGPFDVRVALATLGNPVLIMLMIVAGVLALPMYVLVHRGVNYCCLVHASRFCRRNNFELTRWRCRYEFDRSGVKTESTVVELDCLDASGERRLLRLRVWLFGVRSMLSNEPYAEPEDG